MWVVAVCIDPKNGSQSVDIAFKADWKKVNSQSALKSHVLCVKSFRLN